MSKLVDRAGPRRSPASMPGFHAGRPPRNKVLRYPADPPKVEEIIAVMRAAGDDAHDHRVCGAVTATPATTWSTACATASSAGNGLDSVMRDPLDWLSATCESR